MKDHGKDRVLVTGGAGFIGSHLCEGLLAERNEAICVDNFYTGAKRNIAHLMTHTLFEVVRRYVTFPLIAPGILVKTVPVANCAHWICPEIIAKIWAGRGCRERRKGRISNQRCVPHVLCA